MARHIVIKNKKWVYNKYVVNFVHLINNKVNDVSIITLIKKF
jgi:hypothetical protein